MNVAPVAIFVYRRAAHAARVIEALARNPDASRTDLFIFSDAAKTAIIEPEVRAVRATLAEVRGFRSVVVVEQPRNLGIARSIIAGVGELTSRFGQVIVLEDDLLPAPGFLAYMNEGLKLYAHDHRVVSIHGYSYPVIDPLPETFFLRGADCWGWATWRRGWAVFEPDGPTLLGEIRQRGLDRDFDFDGSYAYTRMLEEQIAGQNDSWAVRWYASAFLRGMLTLYPGSSQVQNIGADGSGSHVGQTRAFAHEEWGAPVRVGGIPVEESIAGRAAFVRYFRSLRPSLPRRLLNRMARSVRG